jgi:hypothetical protein
LFYYGKLPILTGAWACRKAFLAKLLIELKLLIQRSKMKVIKKLWGDANYV